MQSSAGFLPWAGLGFGWHPAAAPPNSARSDKSHREHRAGSSGAYRPSQRDGCTATGECSETSRWRGARSCDKQTGKVVEGGGGCNRLPQDRPEPSSPPKTQAKQNSDNDLKKKIEKHRNSARVEVVTE